VIQVSITLGKETEMAIKPPPADVSTALNGLKITLAKRMAEMSITEHEVVAKSKMSVSTIKDLLRERRDDIKLSSIKAIMNAVGYRIELRIEDVTTKKKVSLRV